MRRLWWVLFLLLVAPGFARADDEPPGDEDSNKMRPLLSFLAAQWMPNVHLARIQATALNERSIDGPLDGFSTGSSEFETEGKATLDGGVLPTQLYRAFGGIHFARDIDLGLELSGRRVVLRGADAAAGELGFGPAIFKAGEPIDAKLEYSAVDLDGAFNVFPWKLVRLELRFGFSYTNASARLRSVTSGQGFVIHHEMLIPMWGIGVAVKPLRTDIVSIEIFARARFGGWNEGETSSGLVQTEIGVMAIFFKHVGIVLGHKVEYVDTGRGILAEARGQGSGARGSQITSDTIRLGLEGPYLGLYAQF